jgi:hypothetical protein
MNRAPKIYLYIQLASDLCGSSAKPHPTYQAAHDSLKINPSTLATVRWVDDRELLSTLDYWKQGDVYGYA